MESRLCIDRYAIIKNTLYLGRNTQGRGFVMKPNIEMGISAVRSGLRAASLGKKAWAVRKRLPNAQRRAVQRAAKRAVRANKAALRKKQRRRAVQGIKGIGRVALMIRKKYF